MTRRLPLSFCRIFDFARILRIDSKSLVIVSPDFEAVVRGWFSQEVGPSVGSEHLPGYD